MLKAEVSCMLKLYLTVARFFPFHIHVGIWKHFLSVCLMHRRPFHGLTNDATPVTMTILCRYITSMTQTLWIFLHRSSSVAFENPLWFPSEAFLFVLLTYHKLWAQPVYVGTTQG